VFDAAEPLHIRIPQVDKSKMFVDQENFRPCPAGLLEYGQTLNIQHGVYQTGLPTFDLQKRSRDGIDRPMASQCALDNSVLVIFMTGKHVVAANKHRNMEKSRTIPRVSFEDCSMHKASRANRLLPSRHCKNAVTMRTSDFRWRLDQTLRPGPRWARRAASC